MNRFHSESSLPAHILPYPANTSQHVVSQPGDPKTTARTAMESTPAFTNSPRSLVENTAPPPTQENTHGFTVGNIVTVAMDGHRAPSLLQNPTFILIGCCATALELFTPLIATAIFAFVGLSLMLLNQDIATVTEFNRFKCHSVRAVILISLWLAKGISFSGAVIFIIWSSFSEKYPVRFQAFDRTNLCNFGRAVSVITCAIMLEEAIVGPLPLGLFLPARISWWTNFATRFLWLQSLYQTDLLWPFFSSNEPLKNSDLIPGLWDIIVFRTPGIDQENTTVDESENPEPRRSARTLSDARIRQLLSVSLSRVRRKALVMTNLTLLALGLFCLMLTSFTYQSDPAVKLPTLPDDIVKTLDVLQSKNFTIASLVVHIDNRTRSELRVHRTGDGWNDWNITILLGGKRLGENETVHAAILENDEIRKLLKVLIDTRGVFRTAEAKYSSSDETRFTRNAIGDIPTTEGGNVYQASNETRQPSPGTAGESSPIPAGSDNKSMWALDWMEREGIQMAKYHGLAELLKSSVGQRLADEEWLDTTTLTRSTAAVLAAHLDMAVKRITFEETHAALPLWKRLMVGLIAGRIPQALLNDRRLAKRLAIDLDDSMAKLSVRSAEVVAHVEELKLWLGRIHGGRLATNSQLAVAKGRLPFSWFRSQSSEDEIAALKVQQTGYRMLLVEVSGVLKMAQEIKAEILLLQVRMTLVHSMLTATLVPRGEGEDEHLPISLDDLGKVGFLLGFFEAAEENVPLESPSDLIRRCLDAGKAKQEELGRDPVLIIPPDLHPLLHRLFPGTF